jgi:GNAT superfamily N-acetyltransferase
MTAADVDEATDALLRGDWGDRRTFFAFAVAHPACDAIVAVDGDRIVGTGVGTRSGPVGWVGTVFVEAERRGAGLGTALTERICDGLEAAGCRTLALVATEQGRPLYERLRFEVVDWYVTVEREAPRPGVPASGGGAAGAPASGGGLAGAPASGGGLAGAPASSGGAATGRGPGADAVLSGSGARGGTRSLSPFGPADVAAAAALDRAATGEDREHLLAAFAAIPGGVALRDAAGAVRGFVVRAPWGGGATIAPDVADAQRILEARLAAAQPGHRVRAGTLLSNAAGLAILAAEGWTEAWRAPRLHRGEPLTWDPAAIWGQFNHAIG